MTCFKTLIALFVLASFHSLPIYATEELEVLQCQPKVLQQHLELNPTPFRMRDLQWLNAKPKFLFLIDVKAGRVSKVFYIDADRQEMTKNLTMHSMVRNADGITVLDGTVSFLLSVDRSEENYREVDTFIVRVYGRTGTGTFLLSSTKLGPKAVVTLSFTGECTGIPLSLLQIE